MSHFSRDTREGAAGSLLIRVARHPSLALSHPGRGEGRRVAAAYAQPVRLPHHLRLTAWAVLGEDGQQAADSSACLQPGGACARPGEDSCGLWEMLRGKRVLAEKGGRRFFLLSLGLREMRQCQAKTLPGSNVCSSNSSRVFSPRRREIPAPGSLLRFQVVQLLSLQPVRGLLGASGRRRTRTDWVFRE